MRNPIAIVTLLFCILLPAGAQESRYGDLSQVQGVFWVNRGFQNSFELLQPDEFLEYRKDESYIKDLLELARQWFSGMIYGYSFEYVPSDESRQVNEVFTLTPVYQIPWGDEHLEYLGYLEDNELIQMSFRYLTKDFEQARLRAWRAANLKHIGGNASTPDRTNLASREESFDEAIKQALRNYFRQVIPNKPRRITGRIALEEMPRSYADGGMINTTVRILIDTDVIEEYDTF